MKNKILAIMIVTAIALAGTGCGRKHVTIQPVEGAQYAAEYHLSKPASETDLSDLNSTLGQYNFDINDRIVINGTSVKVLAISSDMLGRITINGEEGAEKGYVFVPIDKDGNYCLLADYIPSFNGMDTPYDPNLDYEKYTLTSHTWAELGETPGIVVSAMYDNSRFELHFDLQGIEQLVVVSGDGTNYTVESGASELTEDIAAEICKELAENGEWMPMDALTQVASETGADDQSADRLIQPLTSRIDVDDLKECTVHVGFTERKDAYLNDEGFFVIRMDIYDEELYDLVDISQMAVGDSIRIEGTDVLVESKDTDEYGTLLINGGEAEGGYDLQTNDSGVYYVVGSSDYRNYFKVGEATVRVKDSMEYKDSTDLEAGEVVKYAGDLLQEAPESDIVFDPQNTMVTIDAEGYITELTHNYMP